MTQIIFNSQEEFEDAVMEVVRKRTEVKVDSGLNQYCVSVELYDNETTYPNNQIAHDAG